MQPRRNQAVAAAATAAVDEATCGWITGVAVI